MKGQYMFLMCVIFLFVLITLRFGISTAAYASTEQNLRAIYLKKMNEEVFHSIEKSLLISANNRSYIENNFEDFVRYVKNSYDFGVLAIEMNVPTVYANQNITFNTTVFNSLGKNISNVSLNFSYDGSNYFFESVSDNTSIKVNFTFNISSDTVFTLNITYYSPEENKETILLPARTEKANFIYNLKAVFRNGEVEKAYGEFGS
jgi:hypothetical protein